MIVSIACAAYKEDCSIDEYAEYRVYELENDIDFISWCMGKITSHLYTTYLNLRAITNGEVLMRIDLDAMRCHLREEGMI